MISMVLFELRPLFSSLFFRRLTSLLYPHRARTDRLESTAPPARDPEERAHPPFANISPRHRTGESPNPSHALFLRPLAKHPPRRQGRLYLDFRCPTIPDS